MYELLMVRYGELGLKGKNKNQFITRLQKNIQYALKDLQPRQVVNTWGRLMVPLTSADEYDEVMCRLQKVFGIYSISPVLQTAKNMDDISQGALQVLKDALPDGGIFKVESRRSDKTFPLISPEISRQVATYIFDHTKDGLYDAQMLRPPHTLNIEVRGEGAYVYSHSLPGAKGMPVGSGGKAVLMLSGGIDSPVAGWYAMKRGVTVEGVHFESHPFTSARAKEKVFDLCRKLSAWSNASIKLHVVHFTEIQKEIHANCPEEYGITIMRRFMFRLAEKIARQREALAIYTGESVGQVASQTLESMAVIGEVNTIPVLRPLVGFDKEEIMAIAQRIGTYDISIRPYEDCCTVFLPKYPKIRPRLNEARQMEGNLDVDGLIEQALQQTELLRFEP